MNGLEGFNPEEIKPIENAEGDNEMKSSKAEEVHQMGDAFEQELEARSSKRASRRYDFSDKFNDENYWVDYDEMDDEILFAARAIDTWYHTGENNDWGWFIEKRGVRMASRPHPDWKPGTTTPPFEWKNTPEGTLVLYKHPEQEQYEVWKMGSEGRWMNEGYFKQLERKDDEEERVAVAP